MAVVWIVEWDGVTPQQFAELSGSDGWRSGPPPGLEHQVVASSDRGLVVTQVWKSPEHVMQFMEERLLPAVERLGVRTMPRVDQYRVHSIFAPGQETS